MLRTVGQQHLRHEPGIILFFSIVLQWMVTVRPCDVSQTVIEAYGG